jgi:hypothetical protein
MPPTDASLYSSPFILDSDEQDPQNIDFGFFTSSVPFASVSSPGNFPQREDIISGNDSDEINPYQTSASPALKHEHLSGPIFPEIAQQPLTSTFLSSPAGSSFQDSSSDSSGYKRKTSSDSSRSAFTGKDDIMMDDGWKVDDLGIDASYGPFGDGTVDPSAMDSTFGFNDKVMEDSFDFNGASGANSPNHFGAGPVDMESPEMQPIKHDTPRKSSPNFKPRLGNHMKANSVGLHLSQEKSDPSCAILLNMTNNE